LLIWLLLACTFILNKILSTLSFSLLINYCKKLRPSKAKVILENLISHIVLTFMPLSTIQIALMMKLKIVLLLNLYNLHKPNQFLAPSSSLFTGIGESRWNLNLMYPSVIEFLRCWKHVHTYIKLLHHLPSLNEVKCYAYCKCHNSASHVTYDYNVFWRLRPTTGVKFNKPLMKASWVYQGWHNALLG